MHVLHLFKRLFVLKALILRVFFLLKTFNTSIDFSTFLC